MDTAHQLPTLDVDPFDPWTDTINIEGTRYSGALFRAGFGINAIAGQVLRIDRHDNGVVTVTRLRDLEAPTVLDAAKNAAAAEEREDNVRLRAALEVVVKDWTEQFERAGHLAPGWVKQARAALGPNVKLSER